MATLAQQIKSAAKTANSRIRRSGGRYSAQGAGALDSGFFSAGSAKLTTAEKRERLRDLRRFIKETDTPQTRTARRTREKNRVQNAPTTRRTPPPKTRPALTQKDIAGWTAAQLSEMIRREGKTANARLKKIFDADKGALLPDIYRNLPSGRFDLSTQGLTEGELQLKFLQIREFLSHDYTLKGLAEAQKKMLSRMGVGDLSEREAARLIEVMSELKRMGLDSHYVDSSAEVIDEYIKEGLSTREIYTLLLDGFEEWKAVQERKQARWRERNRRRRF